MANEKRLIAYDAVYQYAFDGVNGGGMEHEDFDAIINAIDAVPTIDAVEVVRCKDCKHFNHQKALRPGGIWCEYWGTDPDPDDFCSYGERRTEDGNQA